MHTCVHADTRVHISSHTCTQGISADLRSEGLTRLSPNGCAPSTGNGGPLIPISPSCADSGLTSPTTSPVTSPTSGPAVGELGPKEEVASPPGALSPPLPPGAAPVTHTGSRLAATETLRQREDETQD